MFNWFFHIISKISQNKANPITKNAGNKKSSKTYVPISEEEYKAAKENYAKEIEKLESVYKNEDLTQLINAFSKKYDDVQNGATNSKENYTNFYKLLYFLRTNNASLKNFLEATRELGEDPTTWENILLAHILSKSKFVNMEEVPVDAIAQYVRGRVKDSVENNDFLKENTSEQGDVTHLFDNATRYARIITKYNKQNNSDKLFEDTPTDDMKDDSTGDRFRGEVAVDTLTPDEMVERQEDSKNINKRIKNVLDSVKEHYKEYPQLYYALYSFLKNFIVNPNSAEVIKNVELPDYVVDLLKQANIVDSDEKSKESDKDRKERFKAHVNNVLSKEPIKIYKKYRTIGDCENILKLLRETKDIYTSLSRFVKAKYLTSIPYRTLLELSDNLKKLEKQEDGSTENTHLNLGLDALNAKEINAIADQIRIKAPDDDEQVSPELKLAISKILKGGSISKVISVLGNRIKNISNRLRQAKQVKQKDIVFKMLENLNKVKGDAIGEIEQAFENKTSAEDQTKKEGFIQDVNALVSSAKKDMAELLVDEFGTDVLPESTQNRLFANMLLKSDEEHIIQVLKGLKKYSDYLQAFDKNTSKVSPYSVLIDSCGEDTDVVDVLTNPISFFKKPVEKQNIIYKSLVENIIPKFKDIALTYVPEAESTISTDEISGNQPEHIDTAEKENNLTKDFYEKTGVFYDFGRDKAFNPHIINEEVFSDGEFVPLILNKLQNKTSLQEKLNRQTNDDLQKNTVSVYSFGLHDVVDALRIGNSSEDSGVKYYAIDGDFVSDQPFDNKEIIVKPEVVFDKTTHEFFVRGVDPEDISNSVLFYGYKYDTENDDVINERKLLKDVEPVASLSDVFSGEVDLAQKRTELEQEHVKDENTVEQQQVENKETNQPVQDATVEKTDEHDILGDQPTKEENREATEAGWNFSGLHVTAGFFKFAVSEDNYSEFDTKQEDKEQGLLEGFEFNEENTEDSLVDEKKKDEEFSLERLGKVLAAIKDESDQKWEEIKQLVKQSNPKVGEDLLTYLNFWDSNNWNAEAALREYNAQAVEPRNRSYFWGMFKRNVWPQLSKNPSIVNAVDKLSKDKPVEKSDVDTVEYK